MNIKKEISQKRKEIVSLLKDYCVKQKEDWKKIPYLVLSSYGKGAFIDSYLNIYRTGCWPIGTHLCVDCATGKISMWDSMKNKLKPAPLSFIYDLEVSDLNPGKLVKELEKDCKGQDSEPHAFGMGVTNVKKWREEEAKRYNVGKVYTRKNIRNKK